MQLQIQRKVELANISCARDALQFTHVLRFAYVLQCGGEWKIASTSDYTDSKGFCIDVVRFSHLHTYIYLTDIQSKRFFIKLKFEHEID